jgi:hypothetical protein
MTLYAAGVRRAELTQLKITDIDSRPRAPCRRKKFLSLASRSAPTAIIFYFHHRLQAILLFSHHAHRSIAYLMPPIDAIENP